MVRAVETAGQKVYEYDVTIMSAGVPLRRRKRRLMILSERCAGMATVTKVETKTQVEREEGMDEALTISGGTATEKGTARTPINDETANSGGVMSRPGIGMTTGLRQRR